ncbi:hypothetical protein OF385_15255 [Glutamicibacter sp. JL.03c]|uniref:hypothetical protein n=1 Tax=Glutamicibacter sp. JL.03c TaxID=2984842 RepID=UPI0021F6FC70|nr:hypothetical protein [Glutamicibacter sp. JL.03c]UYQ77352.1 hypothetical protein OF385_15255 [Glutamicibacter sp. JL.03c]
MCSPYKNKAFKAVSIIDIFSRQIVLYRVEEREAGHPAAQMFEQAFKDFGAPIFVHADPGGSNEVQRGEECAGSPWRPVRP